MFIKAVDGSSRLGVSSSHAIDTREELLELLRTHIDKVFEGKSDDEKLFWATYSYYQVNAYDDTIILCSNMSSVYYPIYDVSVEKSDQTSIRVIPYKIDGESKQTITQLELRRSPPPSNAISLLEVLGWEENIEQKWDGHIRIRSGFTGWNCVNAHVNFDL